MTRKLHVWRSQLLTQLVETKRLMKKDKRKKKKTKRARTKCLDISPHSFFLSLNDTYSVMDGCNTRLDDVSK